MRPSDTSRHGLPDLLVRPPTGTREFVTQWSDLIVDPIRQLEALADLHRSGLLSHDQFEQYKRRIRNL